MLARVFVDSRMFVCVCLNPCFSGSARLEMAETMEITGHKTEATFRRYSMVEKADTARALEALDAVRRKKG
jgi:hypothetical protein